MEKVTHIIVFESDSEDYQKVILDLLKGLSLEPKYQAVIKREK